TRCDAIMVGRGALGNPWIFGRILHYQSTGEILPEPTDQEKIEASLLHLNMMYDFKGQKGVIEMRKHLGWYLKGIKGAALMRDSINRLENIDDIKKILIDCKREQLD
ncbi:MAG: dusB, partial [Clostridiales bacterium]|nr:dusB [Clostridiales bacterium]